MPEDLSRYFGRVQVPEAPSALLSLHLHDGSELRVASHEPKVGVLDQQDLARQGIDTSALIPGAEKVDALGSCTANANVAALSNVFTESDFLGISGAQSYDDVKAAEEFAIRNYHRCTDQTGDPAQEWPPTDCGSSGPFIVKDDQSQGWVTGEKLAGDAEGLVSLLQISGVLMGSPWFYAWMEPDTNGFIDGDGSREALQAALESGVAGGHETFLWAVEKINLTRTGLVIPQQTVLLGRNSWGSWGDHGSYRVHLSTLLAIASHCDWRALVR